MGLRDLVSREEVLSLGVLTLHGRLGENKTSSNLGEGRVLWPGGEKGLVPVRTVGPMGKDIHLKEGKRGLVVMALPFILPKSWVVVGT